MLVAFWSKIKGQAGVSTNLLVLSLLCAIKMKMKVMVCNSDTSDFSLEKALLSHPEGYLEETLSNYGFEPMLRYAKNGLLNLDNLSDFALPLLKDLQYDLVIGEKNTNFGSLEREKNKELFLEILELSRKKYDLSFIDLASGFEQGLNEEIMKRADLIVMNTNQNRLSVEALLSSPPFIEHKEKTIYLIGHYEDGILMNKKNLGRKYRLHPLSTVPYLPQLIDILNRGELIEFIGRVEQSKVYEKKYFFRESLKAADSIIRFMKGD